MKIHILYKFVDGPWGGGNQFLKGLKDYLEKEKIYAEEPINADVILFNSHHEIGKALELKQRHPNKIFVHRWDGPISLIRSTNKKLDKFIKLASDVLADGIVFQTQWCRARNKELTGVKAPYETIILNAPDEAIFNHKGKSAFNSQKPKIIATSWSSNWKKGFETYQYLDEYLNFNNYEMTFVGNSPVKFKNIKHISPVSSKEIAEILKEHDIFVTSSQKDPCSNSLIEALSCGLPAVVLNDGGHPELIQKGGVLFANKQEALSAIQKVHQNYSAYQSRIPEFSREEKGKQYIEFMRSILKEVNSGRYVPKRYTDRHSNNWNLLRRKILFDKARAKLSFVRKII